MPIAPETIVTPPTSAPPLNGLLNSGLVVEDESRWENGFVFSPECSGGNVWVPCVSYMEVTQTLVVSASGGTYTFTFGPGEATVDFDADAAAIAAALTEVLGETGDGWGVSVVDIGEGGFQITYTRVPEVNEDFPVVEDDTTGGSGVTLGEATTTAVPNSKSTFGGNPDDVEYAPFMVEAPYECSSFGFIEADYEGRALRALESIEGPLIEREWWTGERNASNQNLRFWTTNDDDHILNPGGAGSPTAVSPAVGLALLEAAIAACAHVTGVIHLPVAVASRVVGTLIIEDEEDSVLRTRARGDLVVVGSGYDPALGPIGQPLALTGFAWAYATGPVAVRLGEVEVLPETMAEALDRATNTIVYRAERTAAVVHDGCCSFAVLIELDPTPTVDLAAP